MISNALSGVFALEMLDFEKISRRGPFPMQTNLPGDDVKANSKEVTIPFTFHRFDRFSTGTCNK